MHANRTKIEKEEIKTGGAISEIGVQESEKLNWALELDPGRFKRECRFGSDPGSDPGEPNRLGWYIRGITLISFIFRSLSTSHFSLSVLSWPEEISGGAPVFFSGAPTPTT